MQREEIRALEIATQICVSRAANTTLVISKEGGENFGKFFEAIYNKVVEIQKNASNDVNL